MILILCLIIIMWSLDGLCSDYDHKVERRNDYLNAERRHKELMKATRGRKRVTRTIAKDESGRIIAQETVESYEEE